VLIHNENDEYAVTQKQACRRPPILYPKGSVLHFNTDNEKAHKANKSRRHISSSEPFRRVLFLLLIRLKLFAKTAVGVFFILCLGKQQKGHKYCLCFCARYCN